MIKKSFILFIISILIPIQVFAVVDDFTIRTIVGDDNTPPTTPTLLSAVPVADSQIDLVWSASTDNFSFGGYVVLRDSTPIATTTLTSFSDTGLAPSTLYTYEIYAFDDSFNISTTSNSLSTTTLDLPPTPIVSTSTDEGVGSESSTQTVRLKDINISVNTNYAYLEWETYGLARYTLRWGRDIEYSEGYINNSVYSNKHKTNIDGLIPNTTYFYEVIGHTPIGASVILDQGQFKTIEETHNFPPANVLRFNGEVFDEDVLLSWQLPSDIFGIKAVRVVSSPYNYPVNINDGEVVYEGLDLSVMDKKAFLYSDKKFYTAFVINADGQISSGAILLLQKNNKLIPTSKYPSEVEKNDDEVINYIDNKSVIENEISLYNFDTNNINLYQEEKNFTFLSEFINLSYKKPFTISIPYNSLPRHLKSIIITILDPTDNRRSYSFLLKINKDGTAYEATIAPLNVLGASRLDVEIFDFESKLIGLYKKQINFSVLDEMKIEDQAVVFPDKILYTTKDLLSLLVIVGLILLLLILFIRFTRRNMG